LPELNRPVAFSVTGRFSFYLVEGGRREWKERMRRRMRIKIKEI
jgi:hypothetical protein